MPELCQAGNLVVVETYPAEFYGHLGLSFSTPRRRSKRSQVDRASFGNQLTVWAEGHRLELAGPLLDSLRDGFGDRPNGEDQFDALAGLYGMINVVQGDHVFWELLSPVISRIEGWIFGQEGPS